MDNRISDFQPAHEGAAFLSLQRYYSHDGISFLLSLTTSSYSSWVTKLLLKYKEPDRKPVYPLMALVFSHQSGLLLVNCWLVCWLSRRLLVGWCDAWSACCRVEPRKAAGCFSSTELKLLQPPMFQPKFAADPMMNVVLGCCACGKMFHQNS